MKQFIKLMLEVQELKRLVGNFVKVGTVEEVDTKKGYRINYGEKDGNPDLSPWLPHPENGGALKTSFPLSKGQTVTVLNPTGDREQGIIMRGGGFSDNNPSPSEDMEANTITFGGFKITLKGDALNIEKGDQTIQMTSDGSIVFKGTRQTTETTGEVTTKASQVTFDAPVAFLKGFTASGDGAGGAAVFDVPVQMNQDLKVQDRISSNTEITAPIIRETG